MSDELAETKRRGQELRRFFSFLAFTAFFLNAIWEMAQMPAYKDTAGRPLIETALRCTPATLGDVVITFWIYAIGALATGNLRWGLWPRWNVFLTLALLGAIHALCIEQAAIANGRWTYNEAMPIIPRLGVGLWPLLQLVVITPVSVGLSSRLTAGKRFNSLPLRR